jgi:hypothetical protein
MTNQANTKNFIDIVNQSYRDACFDALTNYQALEDLLKSCIFRSHEIIDKTSHKKVTYNPPDCQIKDINFDNKGLWGLADAFEKITPHKELCKQIKKSAKTRNELAHKAAVKFFKINPSEEEILAMQHKAVDYQKAANESNKLYLELVNIYQELLEIYGESETT